MNLDTTTEWEGQPLYKVLTNGQSQNGGRMKWSLPSGKRAGKWHKEAGPIKICQRGLHLTTEPYKWIHLDSKIYTVEVRGEVSHDGEDKIAVSECRLMKEAPQEQWWLDCKEFIRSIEKVPFFQNTGTLPKSRRIKVFDNYGAALGAARGAARSAALGAARGAARSAARSAALGAAWDAALGAARGAAWDAARSAARDAAWDAAWDAARDAALYAGTTYIGADLKIPKKHRDHAKLRWAVWEAGYGVLCDVDGVLYCYKGKP